MGSRLARQRLGEEPGPERSLGRIIESTDGEMVENHPPMPPTRAPGEIVAFDRIDGHTDLRRQVLDHRGREVSLEFGEARVLAPEGELAGKPQLALVGVADGQREIRG